jgi:SAM-dependent methyltransferase
MDAALQLESERLVRSWERHDAAMLRGYLVAGVEDPRLNVQSILTRHYLACAVVGDRWRELMEAELRFAAAMNWIVHATRRLDGPEDWQAVAAALASDADNAEGFAIPAFIRRLARELPAAVAGQSVPDYLREAVAELAGRGTPGDGLLAARDTFARLWRAVLTDEPVGQKPSVLEPACGSANDYRFLAACGLARFLDYTGFDLCAKNVANARALFPAARFAVGNVFAIAAPDRAYDHTFMHDLFEHLSPAGLEAAVAEVCRVTRRGLCLGFFQMDETAEHVVRVVDEYHWNTLSLARTLALFRRHGFAGEAVHIGSLLRWRFGCEHTHNPDAYTLVLSRVE